MKNVIKSIFSRFLLLVVELRKEQESCDKFFRGKWVKGKMRLEDLPEDFADRPQSDRWKKLPVLVIVTGYGVISKNCCEQTELIRKIIQGDEFVWENDGIAEQQQIVFVRRERIRASLERIGKRYLIADISLMLTVGPDFLEKRLEDIYRKWYSRKFWQKGNSFNYVVAALMFRHLRLPVLVMILVLLGIDYPLRHFLQEKNIRLQTELSARQRSMISRRSEAEKSQKMVELYAGSKLSPLLDRMAALIPEGITLELWAVNPMERAVEKGKPLRLKKNYAVMEGFTRKTVDVTDLTGRLAASDPAWKVMLIRLDRRSETADFTFRIGITF